MPTLTFAVPAPGQSMGSYIREQRKGAGLTQTEVAARSGVARSNVAAIETSRRTPSPEMTMRLLAAIRSEPTVPRQALHISPPVLVNIEMARSAAFKIVRDPGMSREQMLARLADLRVRSDGSSARWLDFWDDALNNWDLAQLVFFLLSTSPEDVDWRKVSPVPAVLTNDERAEAAARAREVWRATRRVP